MINESSGEPEDLCFKCLGVVYDVLLEQEEDDKEDTIIKISEEELDNLLGN